MNNVCQFLCHRPHKTCETLSAIVRYKNSEMPELISNRDFMRENMGGFQKSYNIKLCTSNEFHAKILSTASKR